MQVRQDNTTEQLILSGESLVVSATILTDGQRSTPLLQNTVMAKNATSRKWVPFTSLVATNGESVPRGIYVGEDISAADLVSGDIEDCAIIVGNAIVNAELLVWDDDTLSENSIVNPATIEARTASDALAQACGIYIEDTISITEFEN